VSGEVGFRARGSETGGNHLTSGHVEIGDQAQSPMAAVFEFLPLDVTGQHGQGGMEPLQGLNASHLIRAHHVRPLRSKRRCGLIDLTHGADLLGQFGGVIGRWSGPVPLAMRLQRAHLLKIAPPYGQKSS
jgi:hypothetical protein